MYIYVSSSLTDSTNPLNISRHPSLDDIQCLHRTDEYKSFMVNHQCVCVINIQGARNKFPDFLRMGTFIDSTHLKL